MEKLDVLEAKIDEMLAMHKAVCEERDRLARELGETRDHLRATTERLQKYEREKTEVRDRVDRILGRLNGLHVA